MRSPTGQPGWLSEPLLAGWAHLADAVGDAGRCTTALRNLLEQADLRVALHGDAAPRLVVVAGIGPEDALALVSLTLFVHATGWNRIGRCARTGCGRVFVDITNGASRRACDHHLRRRQG
ncbi:CGNR zinc finger domain-containing protein [Geodermatophilus sp. SYSU D00700]